MSKSLQDILSYVTLTEAVQATTRGTPKPLPDAFYKSHEKVIADRARYVRYTGERRTSPLNKYGSPARMLDLRNVGEVDVKLMHTFNEQRLDPFVFMALRQAASYEHDKAMEQVKRQIAEAATRNDNLRTAVGMQVLKNGVLYWDTDGNLLPSSSGAAETHSFNMSANNQNQLNGIISASWALNSTDIPLQLRNLKKQALRTTGYPLKYALYGENIPSYLTQNDYVLDYLARSPQKESWLKDNEIPAGLFGLEWVPAYQGFYEDANGTNQDLWGADTIVFTPEPETFWWDVYEGSFPVPTTINIQSDGQAAMNSMKFVHGMGAYGLVVPNPPVVSTFWFDTFQSVLKVPDCIYQADVTP